MGNDSDGNVNGDIKKRMNQDRERTGIRMSRKGRHKATWNNTIQSGSVKTLRRGNRGGKKSKINERL
jgi:hypothetical protein